MRADLRVRLADGTDVGYAEVGDPGGRPVLHLHGTPGSRLEVHIPAARRAAEDLGVRLIALDRPGVGLSPFSSRSTRSRRGAPDDQPGGSPLQRATRHGAHKPAA